MLFCNFTVGRNIYKYELWAKSISYRVPLDQPWGTEKTILGAEQKKRATGLWDENAVACSQVLRGRGEGVRGNGRGEIYSALVAHSRPRCAYSSKQQLHDTKRNVTVYWYH